MSFSSLSRLPIGRAAHVKSLHTKGALRRRLLDIGFTQNATVSCLFEGRGIRAYLVRGAVIALRQEDAAQIEIKQGGTP